MIGEVARRSGVSARMLRHYDALGLVAPTGRTSGGYREYSTDDLRRLFHVESLRTLGLSLDEVKRALDEPAFAPVDLVDELITHTRRRIAAEAELLTRLEHVAAAAPAGWRDTLGIVTLLQELGSESAARRQQAVLSRDRSASLPVDALAEAALTEDDLNVLGALRWALARADGRGLEVLAAGLDSSDADVRRRATAAIAAVDSAQARELLTRALDDVDMSVRTRAALALGSRGSAHAVPVLVAMIVEGHLDVEAAEVLGVLTANDAPGDRATEAFELVLDNGAETSVRLRIAQALAEIPGPQALAVLTRLARDSDRTVAATAAAISAARARKSGVDRPQE
nr:HEAT repeat domain-containing protein [Rhodococcus sp. HNM0569]